MLSIRRTAISKVQKQCDIMQKVSTGLLERMMVREFRKREDFDMVLEHADSIICHDPMHKQAYHVASEACIYMDYLKRGLGYASACLEIYPEDVDSLNHKLMMLSNLYDISNDIGYFSEAVKTSSRILEITGDDPMFFNTIIQSSNCVREMEEDMVRKALDTEPHNEVLLRVRAIGLYMKFEEGKANRDDFNDLLFCARRLKEYYPGNDMTWEVIFNGYESLGSAGLRRQYRKILRMPFLENKNVIRFFPNAQ